MYVGPTSDRSLKDEGVGVGVGAPVVGAVGREA